MSAREESESWDFYSFTQRQLADFLSSQYSLTSYRATQLFDWVYRKGTTQLTAMTNIKKEVRALLSEILSFPEAQLLKEQISADGSRKYLLEVSPTRIVEAVLVKQPTRTTLCLSSQCGCAMGCVFCKTGQMGSVVNLSTGDIIRQVLAVIKQQGKSEKPCFDNVVFMGMGEPLNNLEAVAGAIEILKDDQAFRVGPSKITVSTCGLVPRMDEFSKLDLEVNLAVSLNAADDATRSAIMPVNRKYNLKSLLAAIQRFPLKKRQKVTIEYILLAGVNDGEQDLVNLSRLLKGMQVKVNLIPFNNNEIEPLERKLTPSPQSVLHKWHDQLNKVGVHTTIRWSKGADISAACGQLAFFPTGLSA